MVDEDLRERAQVVLEKLERLHDRQLLSDSAYSKCVIGISWEWLAVDDLQEGLTLLHRVTPEYYRNELPGDMAQDADFADLVRRIAGRLVSLGVVDLEPALRFTQGPAQA